MIDPLTNLVWRVQDTPVLEIRYTLDLLGHVTQRVDRSGGAVLAVRDYGYDGLDRLASEAHASGYAATYAYDDAGRRTAKETARFGVAYTAGTGDRLAGWEVTRTNTWTFQVSGFSSEDPATNPAYRFLEVRNGVETVAPGMTGSNFTAALTARTLGTQTVIVAISDAAGNVGVATSAFVRTAFTAGEYSADAAGCVTQTVYRGPSCREERTLTWDAQYRLTAAATNGAPAESYGYDPLGRRMWTEAGGVTNLHLYDGAHLLADLDATGGVVRSYVYGPEIDEMVAMTIHTGPTPATYYALRDHQNTLWAWIDESGGVVESYDYDAWGRVLGVYDGSGKPLPQSAIGNRFLFQGREYSFATGLYQFRARWYDPVTGRWLSNDPIGISGGLDQYVFCGNDPVNFVDPWGLCGEESSYTSRSFDQLTKGNYTENVTLLGTSMQIGTGLLGIDLPGDIRDIFYDLSHWEWSWGHGGQTTLDVIGLLPLIGSLKYSDEVGSLLRSGNKIARKQVDAVAREFGISGTARKNFGTFIEKTKHREGRGGADNFTFEELRQLAEEFRNQ